MRVCQKNNKSNFDLKDACEHPILALNIYGKSTQDGTPTPEAPVDIVSVGDDGNMSVTVCGKNILFQTSKTETINGITFTPQEDGSILMNGTSTGDVIYSIYQFERTDKSLLFAGGEYTISFGDEVDALAKNNPEAVFMALGYHDDETGKNTYPVWKNEGVSTFSTDTLLEKRNFIVRLRMYTGIVCDNVRIYPQIERGATATAYEPYTDNTATITTGLPLCSVGEYRDELVYNADGTSKIIKRTANLNSYNGEEITTDFISSTGGLDLGATIVYVLATPQVIELSATEMAELSMLNTFIGHTEIFNSGNAVMDVKYLGGYNGQAQTIGFWNSRKE